MNALRDAWRVMLSVIALCFASSLSASERSEPSFGEVFDNAGLVMLLIEPASGEIVDANPAAVRFYGHPRDVLLAMNIAQINTFTPEQVAAERQLAQEEGRNYFIFRHRLASGEVRSVEVYSRPYVFDGQILLFSVVNDISPGRHDEADLWHYQTRLEEMVDAQVAEIDKRRRQATFILVAAVVLQAVVIALLLVNIQRRRRLEKAQRELLAALNERTQELSRIGEAMAHHFQEPARRLVSFAQRLQRSKALVRDEDSQLSLDFIDSQARRLSELVRDAQRYIVIDRTGAGVDERCALPEVVDQVVSARDSETAAAIRTDLKLRSPTVSMSAKSLAQVLNILVDNAARYRRSDRPLQIEIVARSVPHGVRVEVRDNGTGIEPQFRDQVFGLFNRLVPGNIPGTGMGLAIARKLVILAEGHIGVEDGIDGGVCIYFELPRRIR